MTAGSRRFRWVAPDGRRGRWRNSRVSAVMSAVSTQLSDHANNFTVRFDAAASIAVWPRFLDEGWKLEATQ